MVSLVRDLGGGEESGGQELINIGRPVTQISFVSFRRDLGRVRMCHLLENVAVSRASVQYNFIVTALKPRYTWLQSLHCSRLSR